MTGKIWLYPCPVNRNIIPKGTESTMGRRRAFATEKALDNALKVFWCKGYEGASMPALTKAMGINRPSLYAAFGNKEQLFRQALDRYAARARQFITSALENKNAHNAIQQLLYGVADAHMEESMPRGCLFVQGALSCSESAEPIKLELTQRRKEIENELLKRLKRAGKEGDLPKHTKPDELACFFSTILQGMAVQAASGANRKQLHAIADTALIVLKS